MDKIRKSSSSFFHLEQALFLFYTYWNLSSFYPRCERLLILISWTFFLMDMVRHSANIYRVTNTLSLTTVQTGSSEPPSQLGSSLCLQQYNSQHKRFHPPSTLRVNKHYNNFLSAQGCVPKMTSSASFNACLTKFKKNLLFVPGKPWL